MISPGPFLERVECVGRGTRAPEAAEYGTTTPRDDLKPPGRHATSRRSATPRRIAGPWMASRRRSARRSPCVPSDKSRGRSLATAPNDIKVLCWFGGDRDDVG